MSYIHIDNELPMNPVEGMIETMKQYTGFMLHRERLMRQYHGARNGWERAQLGQEIARHEQSGVRLGLIEEEVVEW